jgi:type II secretory pathway pseudopilin PulG
MKNRSRNGFALLEIIIIIVIITILITGGFYFKNSSKQKNTIQTGLEAQNQAENLKLQIEKDSLDQKNILDQIQ